MTVVLCTTVSGHINKDIIYRMWGVMVLLDFALIHAKTRRVREGSPGREGSMGKAPGLGWEGSVGVRAVLAPRVLDTRAKNEGAGEEARGQPLRALRGSVVRNLPQGLLPAVCSGPSDLTTLALSFTAGKMRLKLLHRTGKWLGTLRVLPDSW